MNFQLFIQKYKKYILLGSILIVVFLIGVGLGVGLYFLIQNNDINGSRNSLKNLENQFNFFIIELVNIYAYTLNVVQQINLQSTIITETLSKYIQHTALNDSPGLFTLSNELKFIPFVTNVTNFETLARVNIDPNFTIVDPIFGPNKTTFAPVQQGRPYYCPLSYLSTNSSKDLYGFIGVDICNQTVWSPLIDKMNNNPSDFVAESRYVIRTKTYILDIGRIIYDNFNNSVGYAIHSVFVEEMVIRLLTRIFPNYGNESISIQLKDGNRIIYEDANFEQFDKTYESHNIVPITSKLFLTITFRYTEKYILSLESSNNSIITLVVVILLFIIVDSIILLFYIIYNRKQEQQFYIKLERQNSYVAKMINYVNHEIRNPLNSILGIIDLTRMDINLMNIKDKDVFISNLNTVYNSGILIQHIVNDVLDIRKLEQSKLELMAKEIDLHSFCKELQKLLRSKIEEHAHLSFSLKCNVNRIVVDDNRLNQVLLNLITNAFKFTSNGSITVVISPSTTFYNYINFKIIDTGCGISDDNVKLLFQPFEQVQNNVITRQGGGYGLGLYLCRMLLSLMKGTISVSKNINENGVTIGSIFEFELPINYNKDDTSDTPTSDTPKKIEKIRDDDNEIV
jgi:signal transduction histidine kinase